MFEYFAEAAPLDTTVKVVLTVWCLLLVPWILFAGLAGMAFDGGYTTGAYIFVWSVWTYPITVGISFLFRRKHPRLVWLPALNFISPVILAVLVDGIRGLSN